MIWLRTEKIQCGFTLCSDVRGNVPVTSSFKTVLISIYVQNVFLTIYYIFYLILSSLGTYCCWKNRLNPPCIIFVFFFPHLSFFSPPSQVTPEGTFLDVRTIGRFCYEDDLLTLSAVYTEAQAESQPGFPRLYTDKTINSLKHRLLVYLWRRAEQDGSATAKRRYTTFHSCPQLIFFSNCSLTFILQFFCLLLRTESHGVHLLVYLIQ